MCLEWEKAQGKQQAEECKKLQVEMFGGKERKYMAVHSHVVVSAKFFVIHFHLHLSHLTLIFWMSMFE